MRGMKLKNIFEVFDGASSPKGQSLIVIFSPGLNF
jgi:hypothetical protein